MNKFYFGLLCCTALLLTSETLALGGGGSGRRAKSTNNNGVLAITAYACSKMDCPQSDIKIVAKCPSDHAHLKYGVCQCDDGYKTNGSDDSCTKCGADDIGKTTECSCPEDTVWDGTQCCENGTTCNCHDCSMGPYTNTCKEDCCAGIDFDNTISSCDSTTGIATCKQGTGCWNGLQSCNFHFCTTEERCLIAGGKYLEAGNTSSSGCFDEVSDNLCELGYKVEQQGQNYYRCLPSCANAAYNCTTQEQCVEHGYYWGGSCSEYAEYFINGMCGGSGSCDETTHICTCN